MGSDRVTVSDVTEIELARPARPKMVPVLLTRSAVVSPLLHASAAPVITESRVSRTVAAIVVSRRSDLSVNVPTGNVIDFATCRTFTWR